MRKAPVVKKAPVAKKAANAAPIAAAPGGDEPRLGGLLARRLAQAAPAPAPAKKAARKGR